MSVEASPSQIAFRRGPAPLRRIDGGWPERWAALVLVVTVLYLLIGPTPYSHFSALDLDTGGSAMSPINRYIWVVLLGLSAPLVWRRRWELPDVLRRVWPYLLLLGWFALTTAWALDPGASVRRLVLLVCQTFICIACCLSLRRPRALHGALAASCAIIVAIDLGSWIFAPGLSNTEIGLAAIHNHKNSLGLAMLFAEFVTVPYVFTRKRWSAHAFWIGVALAGLALLIASQSKTSLGITLGAFLATPVILAILRRPTGTVLSLVTWTAVLLMAAGFGWTAWCGLQGADPLAPVRTLTFTDRTDVWGFVLAQSSAHPWGGAGFGSFWDIDPRVQPSLQTDLWFAQPDSPTNEAHNGYLDLLVTTGFVGLAGSLCVLLRWIVRGIGLLRAALAPGPGQQTRTAVGETPYLVVLGLFPMLIALHNLLESSYFNTVGLFSFIVILAGVDVDLRYRASARFARFAGRVRTPRAAPS